MTTICDMCKEEGEERKHRIITKYPDTSDVYISDLCKKHHKQFKSDMKKAVDSVLSKYQFNTIIYTEYD